MLGTRSFCWLFCVCLLAGASIGWGPDSYSPVRVRISIERTDYEVKEPVEGRVVLDNISPATLPAVFNIRLFHDGILVSRFVTSIQQIPSGQTSFSFQGFGIPFFNSGPESAGVWRISIVQQNLDESTAEEVTIYIRPFLER